MGDRLCCNGSDRQGDGVTGNTGFGSGELLAELRGVKGFTSDNKAKKDLKQAIAFDSGNFDAHLLLSKTYENLENLPNARTHYMQALPGKNAETYNNLGRLYLGDQDYLMAESFFLRGLDLENSTKKMIL
ncbi:hypothetical protein [Calothrix sp. UHCC 0171]|uniref:hypothetical protein n=1 Tax=Calothrix sp. UHCC 0171 TaxID=3110245 RepID=UPI002B20EA53|nr:hypothetical protein [Calothrix sp. UHCC 0171]MEA5574313.1 hypothetical protein [Calothrix sp. UHCC 0171]